MGVSDYSFYQWQWMYFTCYANQFVQSDQLKVGMHALYNDGNDNLVRYMNI
jgi:hypothetical protein